MYFVCILSYEIVREETSERWTLGVSSPSRFFLLLLFGVFVARSFRFFADAGSRGISLPKHLEIGCVAFLGSVQNGKVFTVRSSTLSRGVLLPERQEI